MLHLPQHLELELELLLVEGELGLLLLLQALHVQLELHLAREGGGRGRVTWPWPLTGGHAPLSQAGGPAHLHLLELQGRRAVEGAAAATPGEPRPPAAHYAEELPDARPAAAAAEPAIETQAGGEPSPLRRGR